MQLPDSNNNLTDSSSGTSLLPSTNALSSINGDGYPTVGSVAIEIEEGRAPMLYNGPEVHSSYNGESVQQTPTDVVATITETPSTVTFSSSVHVAPTSSQVQTERIPGNLAALSSSPILEELPFPQLHAVFDSRDTFVFRMDWTIYDKNSSSGMAILETLFQDDYCIQDICENNILSIENGDISTQGVKLGQIRDTRYIQNMLLYIILHPSKEYVYLVKEDDNGGLAFKSEQMTYATLQGGSKFVLEFSSSTWDVTTKASILGATRYLVNMAWNQGIPYPYEFDCCGYMGLRTRAILLLLAAALLIVIDGSPISVCIGIGMVVAGAGIAFGYFYKHTYI